LVIVSSLAIWVFADNTGLKETQITAKDYTRAQKSMSRDLNNLTTNRVKNIGWLADGRMWYDKTSAVGHQFLLVNLETKSKTEAFNHGKLAEILSKLLQKKIQADNLPFNQIEFSKAADVIYFSVRGKGFQCNLVTYDCKKNVKAKGGKPSRFRNARLSPDGKFETFIKDYNLWNKEVKTGKKIQLTTDGIKDLGYGTNNAGWTKSKNPVLLWSPGSDKIATFQQDARGVAEMYLVSTNPGHPRLEAWKYPLPGDKKIFQLQRIIIHLHPLRVVRLRIEPDAQRSSITDHVAGRGGKLLDVQWKEDGSKLAFISTSRDHKTVALRIADAYTGEVRNIFSETTKTFFESGFSEPLWKVFFDRNEVLWFSQRDNWGHLYLYNLKSGKLKRQITKGKFNVKRIVKIDHKKENIYFLGSCREPGNPYFAGKGSSFYHFVAEW